MVPRPDREQILVDAAARDEEVVRPVAEEVLGEPRADEGDEEQEDDEDAAHDRDLVALEPPPDLLPVAAGLDLDLAELGRIHPSDEPRRGRLAGDDELSLIVGGHRLVGE